MDSASAKACHKAVVADLKAKHNASQKVVVADLKAKHKAEVVGLKAKGKGKGKEDAWTKYDVGGIRKVDGELQRVELRTEMIDEEAVRHFLGHVAVRRDLRSKDGYLISETLTTLLMQSRRGVLPVVTSETVLHDLRRRTYSGVARLGADLSSDVKATFAYQLELKIPRTRMGHSVVSNGRLVRYVTAGKLNMIEIDLSVAFVQLRVDRAPMMALPCCRLLLAQEPTNEFLAELAGSAG